MATYSTEFSKLSTYSKIRENFRQRKGAKPLGDFVLEGDVTILPTSYDVVNDQIQLIEFPDNTYLKSVSIVSDNEFDTGGAALRMGLVLASTTADSTYTTAVGGAFANQPANDSVSVLSSAAGDTTQTVTVYGTTNGADTLVSETIALNGTAVVDSVKTDWGLILGVRLSASCAGTVTVEEASANADIITLTTTVLTKGINTVTAGQTVFNDRLVKLVASAASTKQIGLKGTDGDGNVIYDSQALAGTAQVLSNSRFQTVTEVYGGDIENTVTGTISGSDALLVNDNSAFTSSQIPMNFTGGVLPGTETMVDVSNKILALEIQVAPSTANSANTTFTFRANVAHGEVCDLGLSN